MLSLALLFTIASLAPPTVQELTDAEQTPGLRAVFDVAAPAERVLDLLWDVRRFKAIFPDIHTLEVVGRPDDTTVDVRFVVDAVVAELRERDWLQVELRVKAPAEDGIGMHGSGLFVFNPPWTLPSTLEAALPALVRLLGQDATASHLVRHTIA